MNLNIYTYDIYIHPSTPQAQVCTSTISICIIHTQSPLDSGGFPPTQRSVISWDWNDHWQRLSGNFQHGNGQSPIFLQWFSHSKLHFLQEFSIAEGPRFFLQHQTNHPWFAGQLGIAPGPVEELVASSSTSDSRWLTPGNLVAWRRYLVVKCVNSQEEFNVAEPAELDIIYTDIYWPYWSLLKCVMTQACSFYSYRIR